MSEYQFLFIFQRLLALSTNTRSIKGVLILRMTTGQPRFSQAQFPLSKPVSTNVTTSHRVNPWYLTLLP